MQQKLKRHPQMFIAIGLLMSAFARLSERVFHIDDSSGMATRLVLCGYGFFIFGCADYAQAKGRSRWWGLLGLLALPGLIILRFMAEKKLPEIVVTNQSDKAA